MDSDSGADAWCAGCGAAGEDFEPEDRTSAGDKRKSPCAPSESWSQDEVSSEDFETVKAEAHYEDCKNAFLRMVITSGQPFKTFEGELFKQLAKSLDPTFEVPKSVSSKILSMYLSEKQKMKDYFRENRTRVCLAIDTWTTSTSLAVDTWTASTSPEVDTWMPTENLYLRVTAQYIDRDWKLHKMIINFSEIENGESCNIGKTLEKCLSEWGIDEVFTVTLDNTSANDGAIECLKTNAIMNADFLQVRCAAHVLTHVVKAGLKKYQKSISKIREVVNYVLTKSFKFRDCVAKEKVECKKGLVLDEKNRWNSTYFMLEAAEKFEKAFQRLEKEETKFFAKFCSSASTSGPTSTSTSTSIVDKEASTPDIEKASNVDSVSDEEASIFYSESDKESFFFDYGTDEEASVPGESSSSSESDEETSYAEDWSYAKNFLKLLKVFYYGTLKLTASSSDSFLWQHCMIHKQLSTWVNSEDLFLENMANLMFHKYNKYWGSYEDMNPFLFIAVLLDPREKELGLKFRLDLLCEKDKDLTVKLMVRVKSVLEKLYEEYKLRYSGAENVGTETNIQPDTEMKDSDDNAEALLRQRFDKLKEETVEYKSEIDRYLAEACECTRYNPQFDLLDWWKTNSSKYSILSHIARDVLAIPVSSITPKSAFNTGKCVLDEFRSSLSPLTVEALICMHSWLHLTSDLDLGPVDYFAVEEEGEEDEDEDADT